MTLILKYFFLLTLIFSIVKPQQPVEGIVVDAINNSPLQFANIFIKDTNLGTSSDKNGHFVIIVPNNNDSITISYAGYRTKTLPFNEINNDSIFALFPINYLFNEITVYANENSTAEHSTKFKNKQIKNFAGLTKDALRSVQLIPGVSSNNEASANINVRGGSQDENLILINGTEVYNPFHLKAISVASIGIFNIDLIKQISFSPGGFTAEYGNALSSVMKIQYDDSYTSMTEGKVDLSLVDLSALLRSPIGKNGLFMFGIRHSYFDYLMELTHTPTDVHFSYYDIQGLINYDLAKNQKITALIIYSHDNAGEDPNLETGSNITPARINNIRTFANRSETRNRLFDGNYTNILGSVNYENLISNSVFLKTSFTYYREVETEQAKKTISAKYSFQNYPNYWIHYRSDTDLNDNLKITTLSFKQYFDVIISDIYSIKTGLVYRNTLYDYDRIMNGLEYQVDNIRNYPDSSRIDYPRNPLYNDTTFLNTSGSRYEMFLENVFQLNNNLIVNAGLRFDYLEMNKEAKFSPRLNLAYSFSKSITARAAWGIFYQPPNFRQFRYMEPTEKNTSYQKATHFIIGIDKSFGTNTSVKFDLYYKKYTDLIPLIRLGDGSLAYGKKQNNSNGYARGFDIQLITGIGGFELWLSYGFLEAKEKTASDNKFYARYTDQRHTLSSTIQYDFKNSWSSSLRLFYGSGYAYTPYDLAYDNERQIYLWVEGEKNSAYFPAYERVDIRVSKEFNMYNNKLIIYLDIMNVLGKKNILSYWYTYDEQLNPKREAKKLFPLLPTLGVSYSF